MAFANLTDVQATLGRPITDPNEVAQVNAWISGAEKMISARLGDLYSLDSDALRYVVSECVARRVRNPDGKQNERIDDYSYGLAGDAAKAGLSITEEEWRMLTPAAQSGAFQINIGGTVGVARERGWWLS